MLFREIEPRDMGELIELRTMVRENVLTRDELTRMGITEDEGIRKIRGDYKGWLCETDGRTVGFSMGNKSDGEIWVVAVLPAFEKRGIGRKLMILVQDWLFLTNDELWLTTEDKPGNRAYGFYESLGWKKVETDGVHCRFILAKHRALYAVSRGD
jgi:ribosomal protein S18 acetylase RimI-like enzyme